MNLYSASTFCGQKLAGWILVVDASCLQKQDSRNQVRLIFVAENYHVPPGVQADIPVSVTWRNERTGLNDWVAEQKKMADGIIDTRTLFSGEALQTSYASYISV